MLKKIIDSFSSIFITDEENQIIKIGKFLEDNHIKSEHQYVSKDVIWLKCFPDCETFSLDFHIKTTDKIKCDIVITLSQNNKITYNEHCEVFDDLVKYDLLLKILKARTMEHLYHATKNPKSWDFNFKDVEYIFNYFWFDRQFRTFNTFTSDDGDVQLCAYNNGFCYEVTIHTNGEVWFYVDDYANYSDIEFENYDLTMETVLQEMEYYFKNVDY